MDLILSFPNGANAFIDTNRGDRQKIWENNQRIKRSYTITNDFDKTRDNRRTVSENEMINWQRTNKGKNRLCYILLKWKPSSQHASRACQISLPLFVPRSSFFCVVPIHIRGRSIVAEGSVMPPAEGSVGHRGWGWMFGSCWCLCFIVGESVFGDVAPGMQGQGFRW